MENVPTFMTKYKGQVFNTAVELMESICDGKYEVHRPVQVLNSVNYGVPQVRKRMFLVAHKKGNKYEYPQKTHYYDEKEEKREGLLKFTDVKSALSDF